MEPVSYTDLLAGAPIKPVQIAMIEQQDALRSVRALGTHNQAMIDSLGLQLKQDDLEWREIDPVDVVEIAPMKFLLADGYHRVAAFQAANVKTIRARIVQGGVFEATLIAAGRVLEVDESKKTPTTSDDRTASVQALLALDDTLSNRQIAKMLRLHHPQVARIRKRLGLESEHDNFQPPVQNEPDNEEDDIFDFDDTPTPESDEIAEPADEWDEEPVSTVDGSEEQGIGFGVDRYGEPYPHAEARDSVELGARKYRNLLINHIDNATRGLAELTDEHASAHLNHRKLADLLRQAREYAKAAIPHAVYVFDPNSEPTTDTDKLCRECGYVTKPQYDSMNKHRKE
jgi:uncharacterized ParB-like nuclease family protein